MMEQYRDIGIKLTPQRIAVLNFLNSNRSHPSAEEIYRAVLKQFPTMSFATVYNTLDVLASRGKVQVLNIDPDRKRYEHNPVPHSHIMCVKCKNIMDIPAGFEPAVTKKNIRGFDFIGAHIEFSGICHRCKKRSGGVSKPASGYNR